MGLPFPVAMGIWVVIGILILLVIFVGLRRRRSAGRSLVPAVPAVPVVDGVPDLGAELLAPVRATYVSSTRSGDWLARIDTPELGVRASALLSVHEAGVVIERPGPGVLFIPAASLRGTGTTSGMAGKFVGHEGLDVLTWLSPDGLLLDTGLRLAHRGDRTPLQDAVTRLIASAGRAASASERIDTPVTEPGLDTAVAGLLDQRDASAGRVASASERIETPAAPHDPSPHAPNEKESQ